VVLLEVIDAAWFGHRKSIGSTTEISKMLLPHGEPGGIRSDELKGTKKGQLSFVTIANAVNAIGLLKLREQKSCVKRKLEIGDHSYVDPVAECRATHLLPCEIAELAKLLTPPVKYCI
jgi:hypothetical protein